MYSALEEYGINRSYIKDCTIFHFSPGLHETALYSMLTTHLMNTRISFEIIKLSSSEKDTRPVRDDWKKVLCVPKWNKSRMVRKEPFVEFIGRNLNEYDDSETIKGDAVFKDLFDIQAKCTLALQEVLNNFLESIASQIINYLLVINTLKLIRNSDGSSTNDVLINILSFANLVNPVNIIQHTYKIIEMSQHISISDLSYTAFGELVFTEFMHFAGFHDLSRYDNPMRLIALFEENIEKHQALNYAIVELCEIHIHNPIGHFINLFPLTDIRTGEYMKSLDNKLKSYRIVADAWYEAQGEEVTPEIKMIMQIICDLTDKFKSLSSKVEKFGWLNPNFEYSDDIETNKLAFKDIFDLFELHKNHRLCEQPQIIAKKFYELFGEYSNLELKDMHKMIVKLRGHVLLPKPKSVQNPDNLNEQNTILDSISQSADKKNNSTSNMPKESKQEIDLCLATNPCQKKQENDSLKASMQVDMDAAQVNSPKPSTSEEVDGGALTFLMCLGNLYGAASRQTQLFLKSVELSEQNHEFALSEYTQNLSKITSQLEHLHKISSRKPEEAMFIKYLEHFAQYLQDITDAALQRQEAMLVNESLPHHNLNAATSSNVQEENILGLADDADAFL